MKQYDIAVVGAGIVGLATAFRLLQSRPGAHILVLDKENRPGRHQTGRNSGVIHSGIYYRPGSAKARNCIEGYRLMLDFLEKSGIPYRISGKLIVATDEPEENRLQELYRNGLENGLERIRLLTARQIRDFEPNITGRAALWVPYTGITDYGRVAAALAAKLRAGGVEIRLGQRVERIVPGPVPELHTSHGIIKANRVVVAAGLQSDRLWGGNEFRMVPFRGEYYFIRSPKDKLIRSMVYPVPDPRYPFLGIHLTRHIDGRVSAGPSAVLAPGREAYGKFDWNARDLVDTLRFPGFWRMALQNRRAGWVEIRRWLSKRAFLQAARKFLPQLEPDDLTGYHSGIRAQLVDRQGRLVDDFVFRRAENVLYVLNAPSPAATASLSIGRHIAEII